MQTASKKVINGWAMYDWANSVYNLVITSTIFPAYYEAVTGDDNPNTISDKVTLFGREYVNTALYNYALAVAFIIVALISPLLSSIADYRGNKKSFLFFFCTMGSIACSAMFFFDSSNLGYGLLCLIIACVGFWSSLVFYNSFLPEIAAPEDQDRVSAKGFAMGYIGSVILQVICFVFVLGNDKFGITVGKASQISFLLVGVWWWGFGQYSLRRLPRGTPIETPADRGNLFTHGYRELNKVWKQLKHMPVLKKYLAAFFFYNMGVQTVMLAATLYGKSELNIPTSNLIIAILIIQLVAIPGAYLIARLSAAVGNFKALMLTVAIWIVLCIIGYLLPRDGIYEFYGLATLVGFVMGGIQSLSRSTYAKLMPETKDTTSFFSFYDVTEKIAIVIGMFSFGFINEWSGTQRKSVLALVVFFVIGLILIDLCSTQPEKNAARYPMKLYTVNTGYFKLDGGAMFGVVPKSIWHKLNPADDKNMCSWALRCLLIEDGNRLILVDNGMGNKQDAKFFGHYYLHGDDTLDKSLASLGFSSADITDVFLTHLHFDHCGGSILRSGDQLLPAFPNAVYWSNQDHWHWATQPNDREKASFLKENILPIEASGQLRFVDVPGGGELIGTSSFADNISIRFVNGHTDKMMLPQISYKGRTIVFMADLLPSAAHIPLPYVMAYDMFPLTTLHEKKSFLHEAAEQNYVLFFEHDKDIECCTVALTEKGIRKKEEFPLSAL